MEIKYVRKTIGYNWTDYKINIEIAKELNKSRVLDKIQKKKNKRNWLQHMNRMHRNRLPRILKNYRPTDRRNQGRPLKRLLDM